MPDFLKSVSNEVWLEVFGRAHPVVLHLPFGVLASLFLLELWCVLRRRPLEYQTRAVLVGLAMMSALVAAGSGWFLGQEPGYGGGRFETHRNLGFGVAGVSVLMAAAAWRDLRQLYGVALGVAIILLLAAGHHGGSMTHGEDFLFGPLLEAQESRAAEAEQKRPDSQRQREPIRASDSPTVASNLVPSAQPILIQLCGKCHGDGRQKGGLDLHQLAGVLAGGKSGAAVVPGDPDASLLMQRLRLPLEDDDHMPPSSKPQPAPEEVEAIAAWIAAGLPTDGTAVDAAPAKKEQAAALPLSDAPVFDVAAAPPSSPAGSAIVASPSPAPAPDAPLAAAVEALRSQQVHVESADPGSGLLLVDYRARPTTDDGDVAGLVAGLHGSIGELSLAATSIGDASALLLDDLQSMRRLDLSDTAVTSAGLADLHDCEQLTVLDLTGTAVDDAAVDSLAAIPSLERVYVWQSAMTADGVERLRAARPGLLVIDGEDLLSDAVETEPEPVMSEVPGDAPRLGGGAHSYEWVADWLQLPDGQAELGNTHGEIVIDRAGNIYCNTDTEQAVMVFDPEGRFLHSWGAEFASGLHGMQLVEEDGEEFLYFVHFGLHEAVKAKLDGEIVWRLGFPEASGKYQNAEQYRPTSIAVAPDGSFFIGDGYGEHWVHQFDADRQWVRSIGGPGSEPGQFNTPHGVWVDTRGDEPELIVADRENHRLQRFDMQGQLLGVVEGMLRRPCKIQQQGEFLVIPDLAGRVTILDGSNALVTHLGDNPDVGKRANNGVDREAWADGEFLAPHSAIWDAAGNLFVMDWNRHGRITKLRRVE